MARPGKGMRYFVPPAGPPLPQLSSSERQEIAGFALPHLSSSECAEIEEFAKLRVPRGPPVHFADMIGFESKLHVPITRCCARVR